MIKEFKKSIGYICPYCSTISVEDLNLFNFSEKDSYDLICTGKHCDKELIQIKSKKDKYSITVDCPICGELHHFNITKSAFWKSGFFVFSCPESGLGIMFIGTRDKVSSALDEQERMISELEDDALIDEELSRLFETVEHINELAKNDGIYCSCGSKNIGIEIDNNGINLTCRDCGKTKSIGQDENSIKNLLNSSTIVLD